MPGLAGAAGAAAGVGADALDGGVTAAALPASGVIGPPIESSFAWMKL